MVFYGDGSTFSAEDGDPFSAPGENVQTIIRPDPDHNWRAINGCHAYGWEDRGDGLEWWGLQTESDLVQYLLRPGPRKVLYGRTLSNERYREIIAQANELCGIKTGYRRGEMGAVK